MEEDHDDQTSSLLRTVEIFENERYQLSAMGWSAKGLLPTDRKNFSTRDGTTGWANSNMASDALISRGWVWLDTWMVEKTNETDDEGWSYAVNFGTIETNAVATKGMTHFVRRRRFIRRQSYVVHNDVQGTCDHCDLQQVLNLSKLLLEALVDVSLHENPGPAPSEIITNQLKDSLMDYLGFKSAQNEETGDAAAEPASTTRLSISAPDDTLSIQQIQDRLSPGAFLTYIKGKKSAWGKAASLFISDKTPESIPVRATLIHEYYFTAAERRILSEGLLRSYDRDYQYHCAVMNCGSNCVFSRHSCPNDGCSVVYSLKWAEMHDADCPYKIIPCPRDCGVLRARKATQEHMDHECVKRPAECPFTPYGCRSDGLTAGTLAVHVEESCPNHLLLVMHRLSEQQAIIVQLHKRVGELEDRATATDGVVSNVSMGLAALTLSLRSVERSVEDKRHFESLERKVEKDLSTLSKEVSSVKSTVGSIERSSSNQISRLDGLEARVRQTTDRIALLEPGADSRQRRGSQS